MNDLLPCPFCGGAAEWSTGAKGDGSPWKYLSCADCEAMGPYVRSTSDDDADAATHTELWNRRPNQAEIARLREALEPFAKLGREAAWLTRKDDGGAWGFDGVSVTWGDFRRAVAALSPQSTTPEMGAGE